MEERISYLELINTVCFSGLEGIRVGEVLYTPIKYYRNIPISLKQNGFRYLLEIFLYSKRIQYRVNQVGDKKIAFVFSNSYKKREDHLKNYLNVIKLNDNYVFFEPGKDRKNPNFICFLKEYIKWNNELKKIEKITFSLRHYLLMNLGIAYLDSKFILDYCLSNGVRHINVFSDTHPVDNLIVQLARENRISTSTMQHGIFFEEGYINSYSDYFLAWGQQSLERAVAMGRTKDSVRVVGMPQLLQKKLSYSLRMNNTNIIGFICSSEENDEKAISILKDFARINGKKVWVKLHPAHHIDVVRDEVVVKIINDEYNVYELMDYIDYAVTAKSTVFVEYLLQMFPVFLYEIGDGRYQKMAWCKFSSLEELNAVIEKNYSDVSYFTNNIIRSREFYTNTYNIAEKYIDTFNEFLDKQQ